MTGIENYVMFKCERCGYSVTFFETSPSTSYQLTCDCELKESDWTSSKFTIDWSKATPGPRRKTITHNGKTYETAMMDPDSPGLEKR